MSNARFEVINALYGHLQDPFTPANRARVEANDKAAKRSRKGRYRVLILGTYLAARGDDLAALKLIAAGEAAALGARHFVEVIDTVEFKFIAY